MDTAATKELIVYEQIKADLLDHVYEPGFAMAERTVCEKYSVSRSPVRCALRLLVKDGLLKTDASGRIIVPDYTVEDILEIYDLIEILQDYAVQIFTKSPYTSVVEELYALLSSMEAAIAAENYKERMEYDNRFHFCIINAAKSARVSEIFRNLIEQKKLFEHHSYSDKEHALLTNSQHRKIYEALKEGDRKLALAAIHEHEQYIKKYYVEILILSRHNL